MRPIPHPMNLVLLAALGSCQATDEVPQTVVPVSSDHQLLEPRDQLIRLSMDLRGIRPSEAELVAFEDAQDPAAEYARAVDDWLYTDGFIVRVKEIFNERLLLRTGATYVDSNNVVGLEDIDTIAMADIIANEALALLERVVRYDLPYTTMVTADYTMANPELARLWGIYYPEDADGGWVASRYYDPRPHAGMLSMTTTWQRYPSMGGNANRHRANAVSKMFLCDDYLSRPIVLNRSQVDQLTLDPEDAINSNASCQNCHASLDPIASNFFGFYNYDAEDEFEATRYIPENEEAWRFYSGKIPGYFGVPTGNLVDLGQRLSEDPRFADCAVKTVWESVMQRPVDDGDWEEIAAHTDTFVSQDMNIRELMRSIVLSDSYLMQASSDPAFEGRVVGQRIVSPEQLATSIEAATGFAWRFGGYDGLRNHSLGLPALLGGIDGRFVTERNYSPTVGLALAQERLAEAAGWSVANHDLDANREGDAKLLAFVNSRTRPEFDREIFEAQIEQLYVDLTGRPLPRHATEPSELTDVWSSLYAVDADPVSAWAGVISAILRDPHILFY